MGLSMFFLGCQAMVVQMLLMRELLAVFSGNELTIGAAFAVWFAAISAGALGGRRIARLGSSNAVRFLVQAVLLALALLPPVLLCLLCQARSVLGVPAYESLPFGRLLRLFLVVLGPVCVGQGLVFPCACRLASEGQRQGVSRIYGFESLGSLIGGLGFGAAIMLGMSPLACALIASALGFGALSAAQKRPVPRLLALLAASIAVVLPAAFLPFVIRLETSWEAKRWALAAGSPAPAIQQVETPYQRLTLVPMGGQAALYANSQPLFMFPDPVETEPLAHSVMARHPAPRSVLLVGGNPVDLGRALLAYPDCVVTYVETDPWLLRMTAGTSFPPPAQSGRFRVVHEDPVWYAKRAPAGSFDVALLMLPQPETVGLNRYYTIEFYRDLRRTLKQGGFIWTSVEATEQLRSETGLLAASVYRTLSACFPSVQVTFGNRIGFFAAESPEATPMGRAALVAAVRRSGVRSAYFSPDFFLADESIEPGKMSRTRAALESIPVEPNSLRHPVTHTYMLLRWNRFSGSRLDRLLWGLSNLEGTHAAERLLLAVGLSSLLLGACLFGLKGRRREAAARATLRLAVAVAGFSAMALELILIFLAQSLFGYVYERMAFIVALFMAGLAAGAFLVRRHETASSERAWSLTVAACSGIVVLGVGLPIGIYGGGTNRLATEVVLHACMVAAGLSAGILFPMVNRLLRERGEALTEAAGESHAADNLGAAAGALVAGVILIPVLGVGLTCFVLAVANAFLALVLALVRWTD